MKEINKTQFIHGALWKIIEQFSTKGLSLVFSIFLTRLLLPSAYGLIALTAVFTNLSDILIDGGFSTTLIRKKEVDDYDFSCVLVVSLTLASILYLCIFITAPSVANYYDEPQLSLVLRVIGLILFIQAFSSVRTAIINRNMQFQLLFRCNFLATFLSGILGIAAAYCGCGVWSLVIQRLLQSLISTLLLFRKLKWKIKFQFRFDRFMEIFRFSSGVVVAALINYLSGSLYSLVVGKKYSVTDLGYSDKGAQLPCQISLYTFGAMSNVLLPTLSTYQSEPEKFKRIVRKVVQMTGYLITPMMVGLALIARELIVILFTDTWLPSVFIMQSNCLYYWATPFMLIFIQVFFALGFSHARVKTELVRMVMQILAVVLFGIFLGYSVNQLSFVCGIVALLSAIVTYFVARPMIDYQVTELVEDLWKPLLSSGIMGAVLLLLDQLFVSSNLVIANVWAIAVKITVAVCSYYGLSRLLKIQGFDEIQRILRQSIGRRKHG